MDDGEGEEGEEGESPGTSSPVPRTRPVLLIITDSVKYKEIEICSRSVSSRNLQEKVTKNSF